MKRFLTMQWFSLILAGFLILTTIAACAPAKSNEEVYGLTACIIGFDYDTDEVLTRDAAGFIWVFEGIEDWQIGEVVTFVMNTKGSEIITDDEIVSVRYSGFYKEDISD